MGTDIVERLRETSLEAANDIVRLHGEIERLRAALRPFIDPDNRSLFFVGDDAWAHKIMDDARRALEKPDGHR
jgi:hypothetical protein